MNDVDYGAFRRLDLNLLVAFDALVAERSVTGAAAKLHVGQPAMSHALGRLRELLGDDILYRDGRAMMPTERALSLAPRVRNLLADAHAVAFPVTDFDPGKATGQFCLAFNDPLEALLLPGLMARLRSLAPSLTLAVQPIPQSQQLDQLDQGDIRLAVGYFPKVREVHQQTFLYDSRFQCVYNPALVSLPKKVGLETLCRYPHIHTTYTGDGPGLIDRVLRRHGMKRQIVAQTATPLSIPFVVKQSPLITVLPDLVTRLFQSHEDLRIVPLQLDELVLPISMVVHRRDGSNPLTAFVMEQVRLASEALFEPPP